MVRKSRIASDPSDEEPTRLTPLALTKQEFGRRLSKILVDKGWTQSELARRAVLPNGKEMGRDAISTYINGRSFPTPVSLKALCDALDVTRDDLLPNHTMNALDDEVPAFAITVAAGHPGKAWVRVNRAMSFKTAADIAAILNEEDNRNSD